MIMDTRSGLTGLFVVALTLFGCKANVKPQAVDTAGAATLERDDPELTFVPSDEFENPCERAFGSFCRDTSDDLWLRLHGTQPRTVAGDFMFIGYPETSVKPMPPGDVATRTGGEKDTAAIATQAGLVRLYERTEEPNAGVQFRGEYRLESPAGFDRFGKELAGTENFAALSAPFRNTCDEPHCTSAGAVYLLEQSSDGRGWVETATLTPSDRACYDQFGTSMLANDQFLFVSAPNKATCPTPDAAKDPDKSGCVVTGAVYVFESEPKTGAWKETGVIRPTEPLTTFEFGERLWLEESWGGLGAARLVIDATRGTSCPNWSEVGARSKPEGARIPRPLDCERYDTVSLVYEREEGGAWVNTGTAEAKGGLRLGEFGETVSRPTLEEGEEPGRCD